MKRPRIDSRIGTGNHVRLLTTGLLLSMGLWAGLGFASAEEGMWPFHNIPVEAIAQRYGFTPTQEWLDRLRLASVRISDGGSGSFVSDTGLVMTNQHVARGCIQKVSGPGRDYVKNGFYAKTPEEEARCPDTEINVLVRMEDVTRRIQQAEPLDGGGDAQKTRKAESARIETEAKTADDLRTQVVKLYDGGQYWLYVYRQYTDVRLVFAPEGQAAAFGGDTDNFQFPRHDLDMAFLRVYDKGEPVRPAAFLPWSGAGAKDGELVFVSGHPGRTQRLMSLAELEFARDHGLPAILDGLKNLEKTLTDYADEGPEQARQSHALRLSVENSLKAHTGRLEALRDPDVWKKKADEERALRAAARKDPAVEKLLEGAFSDLAGVQRLKQERLAEGSWRKIGVGSTLYHLAGTLVRYAQEIAKPSEERSLEFQDAAVDALRRKLFSPAPVFPAMEEKLVAASLAMSKALLGDDDPFVKDALGGRTPEEAAAEAIAGTRLADPEYRKKLFEGGPAAIESSDDPLIRFARLVEPHAREVREWAEKRIAPKEAEARAKLAEARFRAYGSSVYPDATFTLRLSYGKVAGYREPHGYEVPYKTTLGGLFDRADGFDQKAPYDLAPAFAAARGRLDPSTALNFVTTNDIIGGNSGSPVVNDKGEVVGLIFDGNIHSLSGAFAYMEERNRAVAVHSQAILEALRKAYGASLLADEITRRVVGALAAKTADGRGPAS